MVSKVLFGLALLLFALAVLHGVDLPWDADPERGDVTVVYSGEYVRNHVELGLRRTLGLPMYATVGERPTLIPNWHHPGLYALLMAIPAALFGLHPVVLRLAHALLLLVGLFAARRLVARHCGETAAALAGVMLVACPFVAYYAATFEPFFVAWATLFVVCDAFQRHLDAPGRVRWWWPGLLYFLACGMDWNGYLAGISMFGLALLHPERRRALRSVALMALVAVLTLAATAVHYGIALGGAGAFFRSMAPVAGKEYGMVAGELWSSFRLQVRHVSTHYLAWPLVAAAVLGLLACLRPAPHVRRLCLLGGICLAPGLLYYVVFLSHAVHHTFWAVPAFSGIALLAAALPLQALHVLARRGPPRVAGVAVLVLCTAMVAAGAVRTWRLVGLGREDRRELTAAIRIADPYVQRCAFVLTDVELPLHRRADGAALVGMVRTVEGLEILMSTGRGAGEIAFVLSAERLTTPLADRLRALATPVDLGAVQVFRFRVPA